eukprot:6211199-Pleurochrysis_carterae.AAC.3
MNEIKVEKLEMYRKWRWVQEQQKHDGAGGEPAFRRRPSSLIPFTTAFVTSAQGNQHQDLDLAARRRAVFAVLVAA